MTTKTTAGQSNDTTELSPVKRALLEVRQMRARLESLEQERIEPIAVIGTGCRFPGGVQNAQDLWQLLVNGVDAIREVPPERWDVDAFYDSDPQAAGKIYTRWGGFLDGIDQFDPQFFNLSPREAEDLDPQQRLLLEVTWEALENAGQAPDRLAGSATGVFIGISTSDYFHLLSQGEREEISVHMVTGTTHSVASGRLSYLLGLQGPSISLDTACSSSLTAVHLAVQSLRSGECQMAIAGGVNIILLPELLINFSRARMISPDGRCKTFDARADGFVRSEGCGIVVLKRLSDALANRDPILAVIRGSAANQDGRSTGLTAPNGLAQEAVIRTALASGGIRPAQVAYVETHGTGTSLGDPIEVQALAAVLGEGRSVQHRLQIGSLKTNMGHMESAAGVGGLIKAVLVLQNREIPPHLHLQEPNPYIPWERLPVDVPTRRTPLQPIDGRYIAGVSSFGFSGTNVHVVLEAAPERREEPSTVERPLHLLTLSARQPAALNDLAGRYAALLPDSTQRFSDICYTANAGRAHLEQRMAVLAASAAEAGEKVQALLEGREADGLFTGQIQDSYQPEVTFLFTGHGAQYPGMGLELFDTQPVFRQALQACDEIASPELGCSLLSVLYDADQSARLEQMTFAQPALFALEYALARLWESWGIKPSLVMGHSVGEYAAACIAGAFQLEDGMRLVLARGRLMDALPEKGEMAAVFANEETVAEAIAPYSAAVSIAAINGPHNTVISGSSTAVQQAVEALRARRIRSQRLAVAQAAHSPLLEPILDEFESAAAGIRFGELHTGLVSSTTGELVAAKEVQSAAYWRRHLRQPVRFAQAMQTLHAQGQRIFLEIGPDPVLLAMGRRALPEDTQDSAVLWLPSLRQGWGDTHQMLESLAELYVHGVNVDWEGFDRHYARQRVTLPTYPWQRQRYWSSQVERAQKGAPVVSLWERVIAAGRGQEESGPLDLGLHTYPQKWDDLERISTAYIRRALQELGAFTRADETHTAASLVSRYRILPAYEKLMQRWLERLVRCGDLSQEGDSFTCLQPLSGPLPQALEAGIPASLQDLAWLADYVRRSGERLPALLTGSESPLEILFPGGSFETAGYLYEKWPLVGYFNGVLRALVQAIVAQTPDRRQIRVLEAGAGSGGTTSALLPVLPAERTSYLFTDVSELFLERAREKFQNYPFLRYGLFNLEKDPLDQGLTPGSFDLIIAANVLHAARDISQTLAFLRALLAPGGLLLAFEVTEALAWYDVTTALIEGWERFEDGLRVDSPLLSADQWLQALQSAGFQNSTVFPQPGAAAEILGCHILAAQTPLSTDGQAAFQHTAVSEAQFSSAPQGNGHPAQNQREEERRAFLITLQEASVEERREVLVDYVCQHLIRLLRLRDGQRPDRRQRLMDLGVDSLMAVELKSRLQTGLDLKTPLPSTLIFDYPTVEAVAAYLEKALVEAGSLVEERTSTPQHEAAGESMLDDLSAEEVEALLMKKLKDLKG